jgi:hypothetical protein
MVWTVPLARAAGGRLLVGAVFAGCRIVLRAAAHARAVRGGAAVTVAGCSLA